MAAWQQHYGNYQPSAFRNRMARLHRARALLRKRLYARIGAATAGAFHF